MRYFIKHLIYYLKFHKDINEYYDFALGGEYGYTVPEDLKWIERTSLYINAE